MPNENLSLSDQYDFKYQELAQLLQDKGENRPLLEYYDEIQKFASSLINKYGREHMGNYKLFHLIIGSSFDETKSSAFDLPGNEIENFIRAL
jgi:hypothetical protein